MPFDMEIDEYIEDYEFNKNKKCFILGTGPSLSKVDLSLLNNHTTIGVNLILCSDFIPDYICVSDREMIVDNYDKIIDDKMIDGEYFIVKPKDLNILNKLEKLKNVHLLDGFKEQGDIRKPYIDENLKKFSMTKNGVINDLAISVAIHLGFKEIYLIGVDGEHGSKTHFYDHNEVVVDSIVRADAEPITYELLLPMLKNLGVNLYNCSPSNKHNELEYKKYEEVI